ncbi:hypothetical protein Rs2_11876 [Raphanus sativus]|nr:hypothetical protein Rs2_11876 [Raphanus sativus]
MRRNFFAGQRSFTITNLFFFFSKDLDIEKNYHGVATALLFIIGPWLFLELGNPGDKYKGTRHNIGFEMIDVFAESVGIQMNLVNFKAIMGQGCFVGDLPVILAKPQTYMNLSGESAWRYSSFVDGYCQLFHMTEKLLREFSDKSRVNGLDVDALFISHVQVNQAAKQRRSVLMEIKC